MPTVGDALEAGSRRLEAAGVPGHRRDAELLLAQLLETDRGGLLVRREEKLGGDAAARYAAWIDRRAAREPLQHLIGDQPFFGFGFKIDRRALIPRPETELLIERALKLALPRGARVADLGTGSGCIAVSLARLRPDLDVRAVDRSQKALELARENAAANAVRERIRFIHGDLRRPPAEWDQTLHLLLSNPPYVTEAEWETLEPEVRDFDPREALVAGATGYEVYRELMPVAFRLLRRGGWLLLECGQGQADELRGLASAAGFEEISVHLDLRRIPRVLQARKAE